MSGSGAALEPPSHARRPDRAPSAPAPGADLGRHHPTCFGCAAPAGLRMRLTAGAGLEAIGSFEVAAHHEGAPGLLHGGLLTTAFDEVMGAPGMLAGLPAVTARLEVDYRAPVPLGTRVEIRAELAGVDGRKLYVVATARTEGEGPAGPVTAQARGLYVAVTPPPSR